MDPTTQALLFALLGAVLMGGVVLAWRVSEQQQQRIPDVPEPTVPSDVATVLSVLPSSALVVDQNGEVLKASAPAHALGLVRGNELGVPELVEMVRQVRRDGQIRDTQLRLSRAQAPPLFVNARVALLSARLVLVLAEDRTQQRRLDAIRRDFVANVSHELKTPAGALNLLAEAVEQAADDPEAVRRFAARMRTESQRLSELVLQIIELSRLQSDRPVEASAPVDVDEVVDRAIDQCAIDAEAAEVDILHAGEHGLEVVGEADQILQALGNLVANAVAYSPSGSKVVITVKPEGGPEAPMVGITVTDQGIGIAAGELDRIFERFYRVDPARHRSTGGTGLGLSIVKHVAASHGGDVRVWSAPGQGSSFTLVLPRHVEAGAVRRTDGSLDAATGTPGRPRTDPDQEATP